MNIEHLLYKLTFSCLLHLMFVNGLSAQSNVGTYAWTQNCNFKIALESDLFLMIKCGTDSEKVDTLAECSVLKIRDYLYEISSDLECPRKNREIFFSTNESLGNKARINVLLPNCRMDFFAIITIGDKRYRFDVSDGKGSIDVKCPSADTVTYYFNKKRTKYRTEVYPPKPFPIVDLKLMPKQVSYSFNRDDLSYSLYIIKVDSGYEYNGYELKPLDEISYYVPGITPDVMERYCIDKEFFRIRDGILYWKGEEFKKVKQD